MSDKALGMNAMICRRDFLNSTLLASGSVLLGHLTPGEILAKATEKAWSGPTTGIGDYQNAAGDTEEVVQSAHRIRDGAFDVTPAETVDTGELFDCVVVGGGISGMAAALTFKKEGRPNRTCMIFENHLMFGGEARRNDLIVDGHYLMGPQGSNLFWAPSPSSALGTFYDLIGLDYQKAEYAPWEGSDPEMPLSRTSYSWIYIMPRNFGFYFGGTPGKRLWLVDPWGKQLEAAPLPAPMLSDIQKWWKAAEKGVKQPSEDDPRARHLDSITQEDRIMEDYGVSREMVRTFLGPIAATGYGLGCDALSGFTSPGFYRLLTDKNQYSYPGGNTGIARHELKALIPDAIPGPATLEAVCQNRVNFKALDRQENQVRMRLGCTVVRVEHERTPEKSGFVLVTYSRAGRPYRLRARTVVMASGGWVNRHIIRDLPSSHREAYSEFYYAAHMSMNVAVRNWQFLYRMGISGARWFNGFGLWTEVRNPLTFAGMKTFGPDSPVFLTLYVPFMYPGLPTGEQGVKGRNELIATPFSVFERRLREQFVEMFSTSGFDAQRDIAGIILNRWGHAFITAAPGFYFGKNGKPAPRDVLRKGFGRIAFGHSDVSGHPSQAAAIAEGQRAARQIIDLLA
jgi:spermidine dehydrogenase